MRALADHRREKGLVTTYYTCTGDYPSNFTISDPGDNYWNIWYAMTLDMDGYMRWAWDNYVYDMHENITYRYWEPGDGWFTYPMERDEIDENYNAGFYSTPRYEMFKQGIRDVTKAKYLMTLSDELNTNIDALVKSMQYPNQGGNGYGSAVAASQEDRFLTFSETTRMKNGIDTMAKEYLAEIKADKSELNKVIEEAEALNEKDYTSASWDVLEKALDEAKAINADENATQVEVDAAKATLEAAMEGLKKVDKPTDPEDPDKPIEPEDGDKEEGPDSGDSTNISGLLALLGLAGVVIAYETRRRMR